jgi:hypothetical protein
MKSKEASCSPDNGSAGPPCVQFGHFGQLLTECLDPEQLRLHLPETQRQGIEMVLGLVTGSGQVLLLLL